MGKATHYTGLRIAMSTELCIFCLEKNSSDRCRLMWHWDHGHKWVYAGDPYWKREPWKRTQLGIRHPVSRIRLPKVSLVCLSRICFITRRAKVRELGFRCRLFPATPCKHLCLALKTSSKCGLCSVLSIPSVKWKAKSILLLGHGCENYLEINPSFEFLEIIHIAYLS